MPSERTMALAVCRAEPSGAAFSRANIRRDSHVLDYSFGPLNAGCDGAARHPYQYGGSVQMRPFLRAYNPEACSPHSMEYTPFYKPGE